MCLREILWLTFLIRKVSYSSARDLLKASPPSIAWTRSTIRELYGTGTPYIFACSTTAPFIASISVLSPFLRSCYIEEYPFLSLTQTSLIDSMTSRLSKYVPSSSATATASYTSLFAKFHAYSSSIM